MTITPPDNSQIKPAMPWLAVVLLIVAMTAMRLVYAGVLELRTDEAYYWTWSKESVLSFLDHPPGIAWSIWFGTAIFGDTNLGVRFGGIVAMLVTQLLLADIVRRVTHDARAVVFAVLMPEAALYYGLLMAKVAPDTAMIPFAVAMLWALVRLHESDNPRWWLAAGLFAGLALLSKFTVIMLLPAVIAFVLVPDWRRRWLLSQYPWRAALIALLVFSPVLIWNMQHDWAAFRFQAVRAVATHPFSFRTVGEFLGMQFGLVGFVLLPVVLSGVSLTAWRGYRTREPVAILLSTAVLVPFCYFFWKSLTLRVGDTWPMFLWPAGFAATAINLTLLPREGWPERFVRSSFWWMRVALISGIAFVVAVFLYYVAAPWNFDRQDRSRRRRGRLSAGRGARRGAVAADRRELDRHLGLSHLRHDALVFQWPRARHPDQRARQIPGVSRSRHRPDQGSSGTLCRARAGASTAALGSHHREAGAARTRRARVARDGDGYLRAGENHRLDTRTFAAAGFAAVSLARAGG